MNIIFKNAKVLTLSNANKVDGKYQILKEQEIVVRDKKIIFIGNTTDRESFFVNNNYDIKDFTEYDCHNNLLMPSFKNMHTHSAMQFARGCCDNNDLQAWLYKKIFPVEKTLNEADIYGFTLLAILEYLRNGITLASDMYYFNDEIIRAGLDADFRMFIVDGFSDRVKNLDNVEYYFENNINKYSDKKTLLNEIAKKSNANVSDYDEGLFDYKIGLHSIYTNSEKAIKATANVIKKHRIPFYTHLSETKHENDLILNKYKMSPAEYCIKEGLFEFGGSAYHSVHLSEKDISLYNKYNVNPIICMGSNLRLKSGIANVKNYLNKGLQISLGTDGAGSNDKLSIFREMYLTATLGAMSENENISASDILDMACKNGPKSVGLNDVDCLEVGKDADIIMLNLKLPNALPHNNLLDDIVYSMGDENVLMTMCRGKILYENGKYNLEKIKFDILDNAMDRNMIIQLSERIFEVIKPYA